MNSWHVSHFLFREPPRYRPKFKGREGMIADGFFYPCDSRDIYYEHLMDVDGKKGSPSIPPERVFWVATGIKINIPDACRIPVHTLVSPFYLIVPPPEYHVDGLDALSKEKDKWDAYMLKAYSQVAENVESPNVVTQWSNPPWESEFRNAGLTAGTWCGTRQCKDQWWTNRPLPELSRYRVPFIDGLYLCHQSSGHPGGLCLMAIPYNLMHILIEDGLVEPGDWWYPSPWYILERGKISAIPRK